MRRVALFTAFALCLVGAADARAATYLVNNNGDLPDLSAGDNMCDSDAAAGLQCSLRAAIQEANTDTDEDFINFNIPGPGVQKIKLADFLPSITNQVDIDGYTQPGASPNTKPFGKPLDTEIRIELIGKGFFFDAGSTSSEVSGVAIGKSFNTGILAGPSVFVTVQGCFVGTDASGTKARPTAAGFVGSGNGNLIGGMDPEDRNLFSGNFSGGMAVINAVVLGNYVGTEADGRSPLPNGGNGIFDQGNDLIQQNLVAFNGEDGISVSNALNSLYTGNLIFGNKGTAIDLAQDGPTPNDPLDDDTGANGLQNFPVIKSAKHVNGGTKVKFEFESNPSADFNIEFFSGSRKKADARKFLGETGVFTAGAEGEASGTLTLRKVKKGDRVTATATSVNAGTFGATSELAKPVKVK